MKAALNIILILNTLFVVACADNPDLTVFIYPFAIYVVAGFFRIYCREFVEFLTKPQW